MNKVLSGKNDMMRDLNRCLVLNTVRNSEPISRRDITKKLNLSPSGCIHHSDQRVQYTSSDYVRELLKHGFKISMARRGNPYNNAVC